MLARDLMSPSPACCLPDTTVREAAHLMEEHDCGCLPVMKNREERAVIGIVTDRDLVCRALAHNLDGDVAAVGLVMTSPACTVPGSASVADCARLLGERGIRRLVVLDERNICCGVITQGDIARHADPRQTGELVRAISQPRSAAGARGPGAAGSGPGPAGPAGPAGESRPDPAQFERTPQDDI